MTPAALAHLARTDKILGRLIKRVGPCALKPRNRRSPFEALVQSVAYQQLNGTAAATILGRVKALYPGRRFPTPEDLLATIYHAFGIDPDTIVYNHLKQPRELVKAKAVTTLFA